MKFSQFSIEMSRIERDINRITYSETVKRRRAYIKQGESEREIGFFVQRLARFQKRDPSSNNRIRKAILR